MSRDSLRNLVGLNGEFVGTTDAQILTNKTVNSQLNTITQTTPAAGSILKDNGTSFVPLARGSAGLPLRVNDAGTDVGYTALSVPGGGTGASTLTGVLIGAGTSAITTKANPTGAFLDDSSTQTITGAKTFANSTFKQRNPASTFSLTTQMWPLTANNDLEYYQPYTWLIYKQGSNYKAKNGPSESVVTSLTSTSAATTLNGVLAAFDYAAEGNESGSIGGGVIEFGRGRFEFTAGITIDKTATGNECIKIRGRGAGATWLRCQPSSPITNFLNIIGTHRFGLENIMIKVNDNVTNMIRTEGVGLSHRYRDVEFENIQTARFAGQRGIFIDTTATSNYYHIINGCRFTNLDTGIEMDDTNFGRNNAQTILYCSFNLCENCINLKSSLNTVYGVLVQGSGTVCNYGVRIAGNYNTVDGVWGDAVQKAGAYLVKLDSGTFNRIGFNVVNSGPVAQNFIDNSGQASNAYLATPSHIKIPNDLTAATAYTLATRSGTETLTGKTLTAPVYNSYEDSSVSGSPANPSTGTVRRYSKTIDSNNDGLFYKTRLNGAVVEVQI